MMNESYEASDAETGENSNHLSISKSPSHIVHSTEETREMMFGIDYSKQSYVQFKPKGFPILEKIPELEKNDLVLSPMGSDSKESLVQNIQKNRKNFLSGI